MKKLLIFCCLVLASTFSAFAQTPQSFKYQAVARDAGGTIVTNQTVSLRLSILKGAANGIVIFTELHYPTSGDFGVFSLNVGQGILQLGNFPGINWGADEYWLQVEMDPTGGNNFQVMGTSQLLSVPYSLHAKTVDNTDDADADPANELQTLTLNGTQIDISNGNSINLAGILPPGGTDDQNLSLNGTVLSIESGNSVDLSAVVQGGTDDQTISLNGTSLSIENGNTINLSVLQDGVNDADADPANELQTLALSGTQINISNGNSIDLGPILPPGGTDDQTIMLNGTNLSIESGNTIDLSVLQDGVNDADADPNNEIQTISKNGNTVSLSNGGGSFTDAVDDADADPANELQTLALSGTQINISNGNSIDLGPILPPGGTDDQTIMLNGTSLSIESGNTVDLSVIQDGVNDADADPNNEIQTISKNGNTVSLSNGGGSFTDAVDDADADPANELQTLALSGTQINISNGNSIDLGPILPPGGTDDQTIMLNGTSLSIESGNTVDLSVIQDGVNDADADPTNEIQQLSLTGNSLGLSGSNPVDLSALATPWQPNLYGIEYYNGIVYADKHQVEDEVQVGNNTPTSTKMYEDGIVIDHFNLNGNMAYLDGKQLLFANNTATPNRQVDLNLDSLELFREGVGLLFHSRSALTPDKLDIEFGEAKTHLDAGSTWHGNGLFNAHLTPWALEVKEELSPSDIFSRFRIEPDSLTMWTSTKWQNAWLGTEANKGNGGLKLWSGSNSNLIAILGESDRDNIFGGAAEGGLYLYNDSGDARASMYSILGSGQMFLDNSFDYASGGDGAFATGNLDPSGGGFDLVSPKFIAGVNERKGFVHIYDDYSTLGSLPAPKAGMNIEYDHGSVFADGVVHIKYSDSDKYSTEMSYLNIALADSNGFHSAGMARDFLLHEVGYLYTSGANTSLNFQATANWDGGNLNGGIAQVFDSDGIPKAGMEVTAADNGNLFAVNGEIQSRDNLGNRWAFSDKYCFNIMDKDFFSGFVASMYRYPGADNTGTLFTAGEAGSLNVFAGHNIYSTDPIGGLDRGYVAVADENGNHRAGIVVNDLNQGVVFGDIKNFRMAHPADPSKEIWYASLEGPEAAAYIRGTASLENGEAFVRFADHFKHVASPGSMTVILTPLSTDTYGLAVIEKTAEGIRVKELKGGNGNFSFDWEVKCVRAGYEEYEAVRERKDVQTLRPSLDNR